MIAMDDDLPVPATDVPSPTITAAQKMAADVMELIDAIAARIVELEAPHPSTSSRVRGARTVSNEAILSMIGAVENRPELRALETFDVDEARGMLQFAAAIKPVLNRLNALTSSISYTMEAQKARVVFALMRTYTIMKGLARDPDGAELVYYLDVLRRELGRTSGIGGDQED